MKDSYHRRTSGNSMTILENPSIKNLPTIAPISGSSKQHEGIYHVNEICIFWKEPKPGRSAQDGNQHNKDSNLERFLSNVFKLLSEWTTEILPDTKQSA